MFCLWLTLRCAYHASIFERNNVLFYEESSDEDEESTSEVDFSLSGDSDDSNEDGTKYDDNEVEGSLGGNKILQNKEVVSQKLNDNVIKLEAANDQTESIISLDGMT